MISLDHPRHPASAGSSKGFGLKVRSLSYRSVRTEVPPAQFPSLGNESRVARAFSVPRG